MPPVPYVQVDLRADHALLHTLHGDVRLPRTLAPAVADALLGAPTPQVQRRCLSAHDLCLSWPAASVVMPVRQAPILATLLRDWATA
jgi:hypothetical protein